MVHTYTPGAGWRDKTKRAGGGQACLAASPIWGRCNRMMLRIPLPTCARASVQSEAGPRPPVRSGVAPVQTNWFLLAASTLSEEGGVGSLETSSTGRSNGWLFPDQMNTARPLLVSHKGPLAVGACSPHHVAEARMGARQTTAGCVHVAVKPIFQLVAESQDSGEQARPALPICACGSGRDRYSGNDRFGMFSCFRRGGSPEKKERKMGRFAIDKPASSSPTWSEAERTVLVPVPRGCSHPRRLRTQE